MFRIKYAYWKLSRATVRIQTEHPAFSHPVLTEMQFRCPLSALLAWVRHQFGGVMLIATPKMAQLRREPDDIGKMFMDA